MLTREEIESAWAVFGATPAGRNARQLLFDELASLCPRSDNPSALARHEGRRSFARELLELLDRQADHGRPNEQLTASRREPVAVARARSSRRVAIDAADERKRADEYERSAAGG